MVHFGILKLSERVKIRNIGQKSIDLILSPYKGDGLVSLPRPTKYAKKSSLQDITQEYNEKLF